ncbi:hypothetical protein HMPREF0198_1960 [Cardiobacterium hominis ATCC 15826]|uniref:Uncharacterized protein n=1 Tax=Cardiobacterium hominis (strain ATCC 15826 / DSM 8339 / NCTC 10426 / 6573) TaxID=638300 RepID=C8NBT2_CARH6|nr:hypothetical protein HMPREF0198_1960 [Cardiobacterium hominis ATCC 15826]
MFVATRFFSPPPLPSPASPGRRGGIASSPWFFCGLLSQHCL